MLVAQVAVGFHRQCAAVFVAEPPADGGNIHTRLDATSCKQVAQIVMCDAGDFDFLCCAVHRPLTFANTHYICCRRFIRTFFSHPFKQTTHIWNHRDFPRFIHTTSFQSGVRFAAHSNSPAFEITVRPSDIFRFIDAKAAIREKLNQSRAGLGVSGTIGRNLLHQMFQIARVRANEGALVFREAASFLSLSRDCPASRPPQFRSRK